MAPSRSSNGVARTCARGVAFVADLIEDAAVVYDDELPPTVPPGETLAEWHAEHAPRVRHRRLHRLSLRLRRLVRRLDGTVLDLRGARQG